MTLFILDCDVQDHICNTFSLTLKPALTSLVATPNMLKLHNYFITVISQNNSVLSCRDSSLFPSRPTKCPRRHKKIYTAILKSRLY